MNRVVTLPVATGPRAYARFWATFAALLVADQVSKWWVLRHIAENTYNDPPPIEVIGGFFYFVNVSNKGAAWGMLAGYSSLLALLGVVALTAIYLFRRQLELRRPFLQYTFGLMCGGIVGNLIDRVFYGRVVDFLDFHLLGGYRYPAFNVADSGITVGVIIYMIYSFLDGRGKSPAPENETLTPADARNQPANAPRDTTS